LLQANPDGRKWAEQAFPWRKNTDNNYCADQPSRGVDLNRNFAFLWGCCGGSSADECDETFRGPDPGSEPETQAIQDYVRAQFPDQRDASVSAAAPVTATGLFLDLHSYGGLVLWPWGSTAEPAPNGPALQTLGRKLAYFNGYVPQQAYQLYPTDGTTDDFAYGDLGLAAYTLELGTDFFEDCDTFEDTVLPENLTALVYAAKVAGAPYLTPAGPDVLDLVLDPPAVERGAKVELTAAINDTRYNNQAGMEPTQNISTAEYFIDSLPWITPTAGAPFTASPADGALDHPIEVVTGSIDTTGLSQGRHIVLARGRDTDGNWGALSAGFFTIAVAPAVEFTSSSPVLLGNQMIFSNLTTGTPPLRYHWDFGDVRGTSAESDPLYTYASAGSFSVTLVATNDVGSDSVVRGVIVTARRLFLPVILGQE
jgi:hypothetical protein